MISLPRMQIIPSSMLSERDEGALRQFLKLAAIRRGPRAFSDRKYLADSKAYCAAGVLQSIYEPEELHCYIERAADDEAVAAAEAVVQGDSMELSVSLWSKPLPKRY